MEVNGSKLNYLSIASKFTLEPGFWDLGLGAWGLEFGT